MTKERRTLSADLVYPTFFYASFSRAGRFRFRGFSGAGVKKYKVFQENITNVWEFF